MITMETGKNYTLQKSVDGGEWTDVKVLLQQLT